MTMPCSHNYPILSPAESAEYRGDTGNRPSMPLVASRVSLNTFLSNLSLGCRQFQPKNASAVIINKCFRQAGTLWLYRSRIACLTPVALGGMTRSWNKNAWWFSCRHSSETRLSRVHTKAMTELYVTGLYAISLGRGAMTRYHASHHKWIEKTTS